MVRLAGLIFILTSVALGGCSPWRSVEAVDLIRDIAAAEGPSTLKDDTPEPVRRTIVYSVDGRYRVGDLYYPRDGSAKAAAVFVPGVVRDGKDDPRLVAFAKSFARVGFLVLVPEISNLRDLVVSSSDARVIADAVRYLAAAGTGNEKQSVGVFAFSYAAGPALIATLQADTQHLVRFVYAVGPYYSVESVVTFFTTGRYRQTRDEPWSEGKPNPYARWVFLRSNAGKVADAKDRAALIAIAERKLADANADVSELTEGLGPEGSSVHALLTNQDPDRVHDLIAELPGAVRDEMRALDLSRRDFSSMEARLVIMHGRTDPMIPYTEGIALAEAAGGAADLYVLDSLSHVELEFSGLLDFYKLWQVAYLILAERDGMPPLHYPAEPVSAPQPSRASSPAQRQ